jgi:ribosome biogenesis protein MAK21
MGRRSRVLSQVFFQRFFSQKHAKENARAAKVDKRKAKRDGSGTEADGESDDASGDENSDPEEAEIWKVGVMRISCGPD